jgi:LmbE family N-acetylglucosaminyl deacetylase
MRILVLSPHPDDEAIGCGGVLRQHAMQGDTIRIVFLTSGELGGHGLPPEKTRRCREAEAQRSGKILGIDRIEFWRQPDGKLKVTHALVLRLRKLLKAWRPDAVYVTHPDEMHPDHRAAARLAQLALSGPSARNSKPALWGYEVWTPILQIDRVVDISSQMQKKLAAVRSHKTQCAVVDFCAAVQGLNRYRGELHSWPDGDYAEVFTCLRV